MSQRPQIICISYDEVLLASRQLLLQTRFRTDATTSIEDLGSKLADPGCDLVILGHTLEPAAVQRACELIRRVSPTTKVLALVTDTRSGGSVAGCESFLVDEGPAALLAKASELLGESYREELAKPDSSAPRFRTK